MTTKRSLAARLAHTVPCQQGRGGHRPSDDATVRQGRHGAGPPQQRRQGKGARGAAVAAAQDGQGQLAHNGMAKRVAEPGMATARTDRGDHAQGDSKRRLLACMNFKVLKTPIF
jgi:hypothetical protein